jgi:hypothetical protein
MCLTWTAQYPGINFIEWLAGHEQQATDVFPAAWGQDPNDVAWTFTSLHANERGSTYAVLKIVNKSFTFDKPSTLPLDRVYVVGPMGSRGGATPTGVRIWSILTTRSYCSSGINQYSLIDSDLLGGLEGRARSLQLESLPCFLRGLKVLPLPSSTFPMLGNTLLLSCLLFVFVGSVAEVVAEVNADSLPPSMSSSSVSSSSLFSSVLLLSPANQGGQNRLGFTFDAVC